MTTLSDGGAPYYDVSVYGDFVYYASWGNRSVSVVNIVTGYKQVIASNLVRPSQFVVHHPTNISGGYKAVRGNYNEVWIVIFAPGLYQFLHGDSTYGIKFCDNE